MIQRIKCYFGYHDWDRYRGPLSLRSGFAAHLIPPGKLMRDIRRCKHCKRKEVNIGSEWMFTTNTEDWERRDDRIDEILK